jgi:aminoglycoside phosphotransferase (APT) family kinase protein
MAILGPVLSGTPAADCVIDAERVRALLSAQHPDLACLALERAASGWDNEMYRLGRDLAVRLPRRAAAAPLILNEQRWLAEVAAGLPLPAPVAVRIGRPQAGYPYAWSVIPWLPGVAADLADVGADVGIVLARFMRALHRPAPTAAPRNPARGCVLAERAAVVEARLDRLDAGALRLDEAGLCRAGAGRARVGDLTREIWRGALAAPLEDTHLWIHGDLHPQNILVETARPAAVVDWGDLAAGDPATDLASIWMMVGDRARRAEAIEEYAASPATLARAKGWAVNFASVFLEAGAAGNTRLARIGERTLMALLEGP